jgi:protein involved in polysaccharide export with SLBB domain
VIRVAALIAAMLMLAATAFAVPAPPPPVENAMGDSLDMDWSRIPEYRIVPGDQLAFNFGPQGDVMVTSDLVRIQRVRPDGRISVFPIGDVIAAGRTVREAGDELVRLLAASCGARG